jgi:hypothetical protein
VSKRPLCRQELGGSIAPDQYVAIAKVSGSKEVTLTVCANPQARDLDPGTYSGFVRIRDPSIEDVTVPVTVALQSPEFRPVLALFGIIVFLAGSFSVWASGRRPDNKPIWKWEGALADLEGHRNSDHTRDLPIHESVLVRATHGRRARACPRLSAWFLSLKQSSLG